MGDRHDLVGPPGAFSYRTRPVRAGETLILLWRRLRAAGCLWPPRQGRAVLPTPEKLPGRNAPGFRAFRALFRANDEPVKYWYQFEGKVLYFPRSARENPRFYRVAAVFGHGGEILPTLKWKDAWYTRVPRRASLYLEGMRSIDKPSILLPSAGIPRSYKQPGWRFSEYDGQPIALLQGDETCHG